MNTAATCPRVSIKRREIPRLADRLLSSQGFCSMELVIVSIEMMTAGVEVFAIRNLPGSCLV